MTGPCRQLGRGIESDRGRSTVRCFDSSRINHICRAFSTRPVYYRLKHNRQHAKALSPAWQKVVCRTTSIEPRRHDKCYL